MKLELWAQMRPRSAILIDSDPDTRSRVNQLMGRIRAIALEEFNDGQQGWRACINSSNPYDLIIMGWKMPSVGGPALLNRLRQDTRYASVPVVVVSDLIRRKDFRLLEEFPCTQLAEKPVAEGRLVKIIEEILNEHEWNEKNEHEIRALFAEAKSKPAALADSMRRVLATAPNPGPVGLLIAEALIAHNFLEQASHLYKFLLSKDSGNLRAMNGLGRVLYKLGRSDEAAGHLRIAWRESHLNVARLCLLGEMELGNLELDSARRYFSNALAIDQADTKANAGANLCVTLAEHVRAQAGSRLPRSFASLCNTVAVSLVRAGDYNKGIEQYKAALQLLSDPMTSAQVMFNLGLAYVRWSKPAEAQPWFQSAIKYGGPRFLKAQRFLELVKNLSQKAGPAFAPPVEIEEELTLLEGKPFQKSTPQVKIVQQATPAAAPDEDLESWFVEEKV